MASSVDYEPNMPPCGVIATSRSSLSVREGVTFDDFSAAMLFGANFRTSLRVAVGSFPGSQISKSSENVGAALQLLSSPQQRQYSASTQSRNALVTPSWAEGVANHATNRI